MRFPLIPRAWHDADVARLVAERDQLVKDLAATEAELAGVSEKYTDTAIVNDCLTEDLSQARAKLAEYSSRRTTAEVLEEHDVHRKALADALGDQNRHMNWDQLIAETTRLRQAATEWMADVERLTVQLGASEERARQAVQGLRPDEWESRPIDGAPAVRRDTPSEELQRALDRCKELDERLAVAEGRPKQVAS
jgi:chromosome segregation ATPase